MVGRGEQPPGLGGQLRRRILGGAERVDLSELGPEPRAGRLHRLQALAPYVGLEPVHRLRGLGASGRAQVLEQVLRPPGPVFEECAAGEREQRAAKGGVAQGGLPVDRHRDPVLVEDALDQRRRRGERAVDDRDLLAAHAGAQHLEHLGRGELRFGPLPAGLEQRDRPARVDPLGLRLEQLALEVVKRGPRIRVVVLRGRRQLDHALGERSELLDHLGARLQRDAPGLVGQRDRDLGADDTRKGFNRVALERVQIVEPVEEHRFGAPPAGGGAQRVERPPGVKLGVDAVQVVERGRVRLVDRGHVTRVGVPARVLLRPGAHRRGESLRRDQRALELGDQLARRGREPFGGGSVAERLEVGGREGALEDPLALELGQPAGAVAGPRGDLECEAAEREDGAEDGPALRQLPGVVVGVGRGRDDQDRAAGRCGGERAQDLAGLRRVRWSEYEREGHVPIVARGPDGVISRSPAALNSDATEKTRDHGGKSQRIA